MKRVPDHTDARARLICVADRGAEAVSVGAGVIAQVEAEWAAHVGSRRLTQLRETLNRLREIIDPYR